MSVESMPESSPAELAREKRERAADLEEKLRQLIPQIQQKIGLMLPHQDTSIEKREAAFSIASFVENQRPYLEGSEDQAELGRLLLEGACNQFPQFLDLPNTAAGYQEGMMLLDSYRGGSFYDSKRLS